MSGHATHQLFWLKWQVRESKFSESEAYLRTDKVDQWGSLEPETGSNLVTWSLGRHDFSKLLSILLISLSTARLVSAMVKTWLRADLLHFMTGTDSFSSQHRHRMNSDQMDRPCMSDTPFKILMKESELLSPIDICCGPPRICSNDLWNLLGKSCLTDESLDSSLRRWPGSLN